jgi:hypothetical protein
MPCNFNRLRGRKERPHTTPNSTCLPVIKISILQLYGAEFRRIGGQAHHLNATRSPSDTMYSTVLTHIPHLKNIAPHKLLNLLEMLVAVKYPVSLQQTVLKLHYMVINKSLRDFRPLRYSNQDGHAEGEHVNRGRDTPSFCPTLQVLDMSTLGDAADVKFGNFGRF